jgi:methionyl aminopeptidase
MLKLPGNKIIEIILTAMTAMAKPGVKTIDINNKAEELIKFYGVTSINKGYCPPWAFKPFPTATCININNVIAHGIPDETELKEGDIVTFDLGIRDTFGNCADAAVTVGVGEISMADKKLLFYAYQTMMEGVENLVAGANTETIARKIEQYAIMRGYSINRKFGGHAIGKEMHESPKIYNTREDSHKYAVLQEGQIFCVEPMITYGEDNYGVADKNGWTHRTRDGKNSAVFEVMVKVSKDGPEILTNHIVQPEY